MDRPMPDELELIAQGMARTMIEGFDKHYRIFRAVSARAKELFEAGDWQKQLELVRDRVEFYDQRVAETVERLKTQFPIATLDDATWRAVKLFYIDHLIDHKQPELAETFFNSVTTKILDRSYFNNQYIFARPAISTEYIESFPPVYTSYYPKEGGYGQRSVASSKISTGSAPSRTLTATSALSYARWRRTWVAGGRKWK